MNHFKTFMDAKVRISEKKTKIFLSFLKYEAFGEAKVT